VLYRLAVSPGRRALLGMEPRRGRLVRPLLEVTRDETRAYCRARGLDWRELGLGDDPSAVFLERGRVALARGLNFGREGAGFARLNIGTSATLLEEAVGRMARALAPIAGRER
jgi:cystathionine beta-lyase